MINYVNEPLFRQDSVNKKATIAWTGGSFDNSDLYSESITLQETICDQQALRFGSCYASELKFKVGELATSMKGKRITYSSVLNGDTVNPFVYGVYNVESDVADINHYGREITAYDDLYGVLNADVAEWYNSLTFPMTLKQFRDAFFTELGITQETVTLVNDSMVVTKTIDPSELSGGRVLTSICELNGAFGHMGRDNKFKYIFLNPPTLGLYPAEDLYPSEDLFPSDDSSDYYVTKNLYQKCYPETYQCQIIDKLQIRQEENDIGAIVGTGDNCYIVQDNFLVYGMNSTDLTSVAQNLLGVISGVYYTPCEVIAKGNPCVEVGDSIKIFNDGNAIVTYVLDRTLTGVQSLTDEYRSQGTEYQEENLNTVNHEIIQLKGKTTKIDKTIEGITTRVEDIEDGSASIIQQLSSSISAKVSQTGGSPSTFGWELTANAFELKSNNRTVFKCDANGISVDGYASVSRVNSVEAQIDNLEAIAITTQNLSAQTIQGSQITGLTISANQITSGTISASRISTDLLRTNQLSSGALDSTTIRADGIVCLSDVDGQGGRFDYLSVNGHTINLSNTTYSGEKLVTWT